MEQTSTTSTTDRPRTDEPDQVPTSSPRRRFTDLARRPVGVAVAGVVLAAATFTGGLVVGRATAADPGTTSGFGQGPGGQGGPGGRGGFGQQGPGQQGQQGQPGQQGQQQAPGQVPALPTRPGQDDDSSGGTT